MARWPRKAEMRFERFGVPLTVTQLMWLARMDAEILFLFASMGSDEALKIIGELTRPR